MDCCQFTSESVEAADETEQPVYDLAIGRVTFLRMQLPDCEKKRSEV